MILEIIQFCFLYLLSCSHNDVVTTPLRRRYPTSSGLYHLATMEMSDNVAKTTSFRRLIMTPLWKTLQESRFWNFVWRFHCNYMSMSEQRQIASPTLRRHWIYWVVNLKMSCKNRSVLLYVFYLKGIFHRI